MAAKGRFTKGLLYALAALLVLGVLAIASHDAVFRWLTLQAVQRVPDFDAHVDGHFDVTHAIPLTLDASEIRLAFRGGELEGTRARLQKLHLEVDLWHLLRGVVYIEQLIVADADIDIPPSRATITKPPPTAIRMPFVKELRLERVHVRFQRKPDTKPHELNIAHLEAGAGKDGDLKVNATATLDGDSLTLNSTFGSVEQFVRPTAPFPVDATLRAPGWDLEARVSGTLTEPLHGGGAELEIRATISDASPLRDVFFPGAPFAGAVDAKAKLSGDLHAPVLSNLDLTLDDGDRLHLAIDGNVDNLQSLEGLDLQVEITSHDSTVTRYLLRDVRTPVNTLRIQTGIRGSASDLLVENLEAEISGANVSSVGARGAIHLSDTDSEWSIKAAQLDLQVTARIADLNAWLPEAVGKTGTLRGKVHVEASDQSWVFDNVDLELDKTEPLRGFLRGKLAYTTAQLEAIRAEDRGSAKPWVPVEFDLSLDLEIGDSKSLAILFQQEVPDLGPVSVKARLSRDGKVIQVTKLDALTTGKRPLSFATKGQLTLAPEDKWFLKSAQLDLQVTAPVADLKSWLPEAVTKTGTMRANVHIEGSDQSWVFDNVDLELDKTEPLRGFLRGKLAYTTAQLEAIRAEDRGSAKPWVPVDFDLNLDLATTDSKSLAILFQQEVPDLGPVSAKARLTRDGESIQITKLDATTTGKRPLSIATTGQLTLAGINSTLRLRDIHLELEAKGENAESVAPFVGSLPIDPGPWSLQARLTGETGEIQVEALKFVSTAGDSVQIELDGTIPDLNRLLASAGKSPDGVILNGHVSAASTDKLGPLIGEPVPDLGRFDARFEARGEKGDWTVSNTTLSVNNDSGIEIQVTGQASQLLHDPRIDAHLNVHVPDLKRSLDTDGISIPRIAAITVDAQLEGDHKKARFVGRIDIGSTPFDAELELDWMGPRPYLMGTVSTPALMLDDFVNPAGWSSEPSGKAARSVTVPSARSEEVDPSLQATPLRFDLLQDADIDLELIADKIEGKRIRTERLELAVKVDNGRLKVHHKKLKHEHGAVTMSLEVDNTVEPPEVAFKGQGDYISLGALHAQVSDNPELLEGSLSFDVDMAGQGRSHHQILATANGYYGLILEDAKLTGRDLDVMAFDFLQLLTTTVASKDHTTVECAIAKFKLDDGVASSNNLYVHTPKMFATGTGEINFKTDTLDFLVTTDAKRKIFGKRAALRIYGPIHDPKVDTNVSPQAVASAITSAGAAALLAVPKIGFSIVGLPFLDDLLKNDESSPCTAVVASARRTGDSKAQ